MKIYTGTGDGGKTSLFSGERCKKNNVRVEAYGEVDELCSFIGGIVAALPECEEKDKISQDIEMIQSDLFAIGAILATLPGTTNFELLQPIKKEKTKWLEEKIDALQIELPELRCFILPGGHISSAWSQVARAVCRRVERCLISLMDEEGKESYEEIVSYINRLSDYLFVLARFCNKITGISDTHWHGK